MFKMKMIRLNFLFLHIPSSTFDPGGGKKGVAIRPYPSPGPPPFIPNAFIKCGTLTGSDSCWASSPTRECELGEEFLLAKKKLRPTQNLLSSTQPNTNRSPQGFTHIKSVRVEGDGAPGKGQRANRNALAPSPGFKTM